jgi:type II secretory pathway pseudopilin PulG
MQWLEQLARATTRATAALNESSESSPGAWTLGGFWLTAGGVLIGVASLVLAVLIFRSTNRSDQEKHGELLDALHAAQSALEQTIQRTGATQANLAALGLSVPESEKVDEFLGEGEVAVFARRRATGKGNHPWQVVTSRGRVIQIYTGGRTGGVHGSALDE